MTPHQVELVQRSWSRIAPIADTAAKLFYSNLFSRDPSLERLFKGDMQAQGSKLMAMIGVAVRALDNLEALVPQVKALGRRHGGYGVKAEHYETVGAALLQTLRQGLGEAFTIEVRDAWAAAYGVLSSTMKEASNEQAARTA